MRNILIPITFISTITGCVITQTPAEKDKAFVKQTFDKAYSVTSSLNVEAGSDYASTFKSIGSGFRATVSELKSDYGTFYLFRSKTGHAWPLHQHSFYDAADNSFSGTCTGKTSPITSFEDADRNGLFAPLQYTTQEKLKLMKERSISHSKNELTNEYTLPLFILKLNFFSHFELVMGNIL